MTETNKKNCTCNSDEKSHCSYIHGISCDVKSCIHHDSETHCTADCIEVGPSFAASSNDTACATFRPRKD